MRRPHSLPLRWDAAAPPDDLPVAVPHASERSLWAAGSGLGVMEHHRARW